MLVRQNILILIYIVLALLVEINSTYCFAKSAKEWQGKGAQTQRTRTATVPVRLAQQVIKDLNNEDWLKEYDGNLIKLTQTWRTEPVDLNADGIPEFIVIPLGSKYCGAGGCAVWIYRKTGEGYEALFGMGDEGDDEGLFWGGRLFVSFGPLRTYTNGYFDLQMIDAIDDAPNSHKLYILKFDGRRYHWEECNTREFIGRRQGKPIYRVIRNDCF